MTQGATREWAEQIEPDGQAGFEPGQPMEVPADNWQQVAGVVGEAALILKRLGGVVAISARRKEIAKGVYVTTALIFKWDSYGGPAERLSDEPEAKSDE